MIRLAVVVGWGVYFSFLWVGRAIGHVDIGALSAEKFWRLAVSISRDGAGEVVGKGGGDRALMLTFRIEDDV